MSIEENMRRKFGTTTHTGTALSCALEAQAKMLQNFSDNPYNPNMSGWLREGAIQLIRQIEREARG